MSAASRSLPVTSPAGRTTRRPRRPTAAAGTTPTATTTLAASPTTPPTTAPLVAEHTIVLVIDGDTVELDDGRTLAYLVAAGTGDLGVALAGAGHADYYGARVHGTSCLCDGIVCER